MDVNHYASKRWMLVYGEPDKGKSTIMFEKHCDHCGHSNGNHDPSAQAHCLIPGCDCESLSLRMGKHAGRCQRCHQDTSEYDAQFSRWCGACRDEAEAEKVYFDLDDEPYRVGDIGPWRVSYCCWAYAKGTDNNIVCRVCYGDAEHMDTPARPGPHHPGGGGDRFGRKP